MQEQRAPTRVGMLVSTRILADVRFTRCTSLVYRRPYTSRHIALSLAFTATDFIAVPAKSNQRTSHRVSDVTRPYVIILGENGSVSTDVQSEE